MRRIFSLDVVTHENKLKRNDKSIILERKYAQKHRINMYYPHVYSFFKLIFISPALF